MPNRGILSGLRPLRQDYRPQLVDSAGRPVNLGDTQSFFGNVTGRTFGTGRYSIVDGWCIGSAEFSWGSGGNGGGTLGTLYASLPVPGISGAEGGAGEYVIGGGHAGRLLGNGRVPISAIMLGVNPTPTVRPGQWAFFSTPDQVRTGLVSVPIGASSLVVSHGLGSTPGGVVATPAETWATATQGGAVPTTGHWVDTLTNTQFTLHAGNTNLTAAMDFYWMALHAATALSTVAPFPWGTAGDHLGFTFSYPVA